MLAIVETFEGAGVIANGTCGVCGWRGLDVWDIGLRLVRDDRGAILRAEHDEEPLCVCPRCGLREAVPDLGQDDQGGGATSA